MRILTLVAVLSVLGGCDADGADEPTPEETAAAIIADRAENPARCGAAPYSWRPVADMGAVRATQEEPAAALDLATIELLLDVQGFVPPEPPQHDVDAWRIRYGTQDRGRAMDATALVTAPRVTAPESFPVMLLMHGATGFHDACAGTNADLYRLLASIFASFGFVVVAPDYIGTASFGPPSFQRQHFLVSEQVAIGSIDALRGTLAALPDLSSGATASAQTVVLGPSQGGHGTLSVLRYAPYYLPERVIDAGVALVPDANPYGAFLHLLREGWTQPRLGLHALRTLSYADFYGTAGDIWSPFADPEIVWLVDETYYDYCFGEYAPGLETVEAPEDMFAAALLDEEALPEWFECQLRENSLPTTSVARLDDTPVLMNAAELDELIPVESLRDAAQALCDAGQRIEYLECAGAGHTDGAVAALAQSLTFIRARLAGETWDADRICDVSPPVDCAGAAN